MFLSESGRFCTNIRDTRKGFHNQGDFVQSEHGKIGFIIFKELTAESGRVASSDIKAP